MHVAMPQTTKQRVQYLGFQYRVFAPDMSCSDVQVGPMCGGVFAAVLYEIGFRPTRYPVSAFSDLHTADSMHAGGEMLILAQQGNRERDLFQMSCLSWNAGVVHRPLFWSICSITYVVT